VTAVTAAPPVHDLLLALAGRLDDDLLAWARELLAVGEGDQAVELATAALAAERVVLPSTLRAALVAAARAAQTDLDVESALAAGAAEEGTRHRFDAAAAPGDAVCAVLTALPARRLTGCTLHLTWRTTPAGAAPGPLPRAVVLVEADPDRSADVLAYLLATELDRAGAPASVEVFTVGRPLPAYHAAALRSARRVLRGTTAEQPAAEQPAAAPGRHGAPAESTSLFLVSDTAANPGPDAARPEPVPSDTEPRPDAPSEEAAEPAPPTGRRRRPEPAASDGAFGTPGTTGPFTVAAPAPHLPDPLDAPPDTDPLNGPLQIPLLAPLLDPTGVDPGAERAVPRGADTGQASEPESPPAGPAPASPAPAPEPAAAPVPAEWEEDWRSGEWAMPHTPRPASDRPRPDAFGPAGGAEPAAADLPRRTQRTDRLLPRGGPDGSGGVPAVRPDAAPPAGRDGVSLFESPTARVSPGPGPHPAPPRSDGRRDGAPSDPGQHPGGALFPRAAGGPTPRDRPVRPRADRPAADDPLFGPGKSDVPLFGGAPGPNGHAPDPQRPGRRRRPEPDAPPPFTAAEPDHVPAPSRPGDDPVPPALEGTEGDLLAQLQAELAARERRPRPYRRAEQNGSTHTVNGNGHAPGGDRPPPDRAS